MTDDSASKGALVWCPFPDRETAREAIKILLDEDLIRCANLVGEVESLYTWKQKLESGTEIGVLLKTRSESLEHLVVRLEELHPYDTPAILGWQCDAAAPATLDWLHALGGK